MPQIIPLTSDPDRTFDVELGGNLLTLRTYYNPTVPGWYMDIEGRAKGLALVPFADVFESSPELQRTIGQMRLIVSDGADVVAEALPQDTSDPLAGVRVWRGSVEPDGAVNGDLWIDTGSTNLLQRSEEFESAYWTRSGATVSINAIASPDGSATAEKIIESAATADHALRLSSTSLSAGQHVLSIYAKAAERTTLTLYKNNSGSNEARLFNLSTGATSANGIGYGNATGYGMEDVGGGWWRCWILVNSTGGSSGVGFQLQGPSYAGDGTSGLYLWGAQLEQASAIGRYIPTASASVSTIGRGLTYIRNVNSWVASSLPSRAAPEPRATLGSSAQLWWFAPGEWVSDDEAPTLDPVPGSGGYVVA